MPSSLRNALDAAGVALRSATEPTDTQDVGDLNHATPTSSSSSSPS